MAAWPIFSAILAAGLSPGAADRSTPPGWSRQAPVTMRGIGAYSIAVPAGLVGGPEQGIDSLIADYRSAGLRLSFDFGSYGALPDCRAHTCSPIEIDGLSATLARAERPPRTGAPVRRWLHLYVPLPSPNEWSINLVVYATCATVEDCDIAMRVFESIDFNLAANPRFE